MKWVRGSSGLWVQINASGSGEGVPAGITPVANHKVTLAKTVGGSSLAMATSAIHGACFDSVTFRGQQYSYFLDHGQEWLQVSGAYGASNPLGLNFCTLPTGAGSQGDGNNQHVCTSVVLFAGVDNVSAPTRLYVRTRVAEWLPPGRITAPVPYNNNKVSEYEWTIDTQIGYFGDDQIVDVKHTYQVFATTQSQAMRYAAHCPGSLYAPAAFSRFYTVDRVTGVVTEVFPVANDGVGIKSTTAPFIMATSDGSHAQAVYCPVDQLQELGYYQCLKYDAFSFCFFYDKHDHGPSGMQPGTYSCPVKAVVGTLDEVRTKIRDVLYANLG